MNIDNNNVNNNNNNNHNKNNNAKYSTIEEFFQNFNNNDSIEFKILNNFFDFNSTSFRNYSLLQEKEEKLVKISIFNFFSFSDLEFTCKLNFEIDSINNNNKINNSSNNNNNNNFDQFIVNFRNKLMQILTTFLQILKDFSQFISKNFQFSMVNNTLIEILKYKFQCSNSNVTTMKTIKILETKNRPFFIYQYIQNFLKNFIVLHQVLIDSIHYTIKKIKNLEIVGKIKIEILKYLTSSMPFFCFFDTLLSSFYVLNIIHKQELALNKVLINKLYDLKLVDLLPIFLTNNVDKSFCSFINNEKINNNKIDCNDIISSNDSDDNNDNKLFYESIENNVFFIDIVSAIETKKLCKFSNLSRVFNATARSKTTIFYETCKHLHGFKNCCNKSLCFCIMRLYNNALLLSKKNTSNNNNINSHNNNHNHNNNNNNNNSIEDIFVFEQKENIFVDIFKNERNFFLEKNESVLASIKNVLGIEIFNIFYSINSE
jgi:hypothetical protein